MIFTDEKRYYYIGVVYIKSLFIDDWLDAFAIEIRNNHLCASIENNKEPMYGLKTYDIEADPKFKPIYDMVINNETVREDMKYTYQKLSTMKTKPEYFSMLGKYLKKHNII